MIETKKVKATSAKDFTVHPAAEEFPRLSGEEFALFKQDIKTNGLRVPLLVMGTVVLDGRNRLQACKELKITPEIKQYTGQDPVGEVISRNIMRRHLTDDQRVAIVAELRGAELSKEAKASQKAALKGGKVDKKGEVAGRLAKEAGVSLHKGKAAMKAAKHAPGALDEVILGKGKLAAAAKKASAAKAEKDKKAGKTAKAPKVLSLQERVEKKFLKFMESFTPGEYPMVRKIVRAIVALADKSGHGAAFANVK